MAFNSLAWNNRIIDPRTKKGDINMTWDQPRMDTLPRIQPIICLSSSPVNAIIKEIKAPRKELKIIPVKIIVSTRIARSIFRAKYNTIKIVKKDANILNNGRVKEPIHGSEILKKIVITAPTEAPEDTPKVKGSANGFLNKP